MGKIKEWSTLIWQSLPSDKNLNIKQQAARLEKEFPWFDYRRLRDLRSSRDSYKESQKEIDTFKKVFAKELAYLKEADKANSELDEMEKQLEDLQEKADKVERIEEMLARSLATQEEILKQLEELKKEK